MYTCFNGAMMIHVGMPDVPLRCNVYTCVYTYVYMNVYMCTRVLMGVKAELLVLYCR